MEPKPRKLGYARPDPKPRTDWAQIGWGLAAFLFMLMCVLFAWFFRNP